MNKEHCDPSDHQSPDSVFQRVTHPYQDKPLLLVTGIGRSGTTALRTALNAHPNLHGTDRENNVIYDFLHAGKQNCTLDSRRFAMATDDFTYRKLLRLYLLNLLWPQPRHDLDDVLGIQGFSALTSDRLDFLREVFPNVKVLLIVRHGVEVVASRMVYQGFRNLSFEAQCTSWQAGAEFAATVADDQDVMVIRHEQLIDGTMQEDIIDRMLAFAGLPPSEHVQDVLSTRKFHPTEVQGESSVSADDLRKRKDRWKLWTESQQQQFIDICSTGMKQLGYQMP